MAGAQKLRDAFNRAAAGAAMCQTALLGYEQVMGGDGKSVEVQILTFRGRKPDGTMFDVSSGPLSGGVDVFLEAAAVARDLVRPAPPIALPPPTEG